jgi:hypothetical protein
LKMKRKSQATVLHHYSATEQKIQTARKLWKHALDLRPFDAQKR